MLHLFGDTEESNKCSIYYVMRIRVEGEEGPPKGRALNFPVDGSASSLRRCPFYLLKKRKLPEFYFFTYMLGGDMVRHAGW
jgi:hypothetical protein